MSRDHHQALRVAQQLRRADDVDRATKAFFDFWATEGQRHFQVEEDVLLPYWGALGTIDEEMAMRALREHLRIRAAILRLRRAPTLEGLTDLGNQLAAHVRFEERELFALLESNLSEEKQQALARAVTAAEGQLARSDAG